MRNLVLVLCLVFVFVGCAGVLDDTPTLGDPIQVILSMSADTSEDASGTDSEEVLARGAVASYENESVMALVARVLTEEGIGFATTGAGSDEHLRAAMDIEAGSTGESSGWMFLVNGIPSFEPMGSYTLSDGDRVEVFFLYELFVPNAELEEDDVVVPDDVVLEEE